VRSSAAAAPAFVLVTAVRLVSRVAPDGAAGPLDLLPLPGRVAAAFGQACGIFAASTESGRELRATSRGVAWGPWVTAAWPTPSRFTWWPGPIATPVASTPVAANRTPSFTATPVLETAPAPTAISGPFALLGAVVSHFASGQGVTPVTARRSVALAR
jgi:hypothetical protein